MRSYLGDRMRRSSKGLVESESFASERQSDGRTREKQNSFLALKRVEDVAEQRRQNSPP